MTNTTNTIYGYGETLNLRNSYVDNYPTPAHAIAAHLWLQWREYRSHDFTTKYDCGDTLLVVSQGDGIDGKAVYAIDVVDGDGIYTQYTIRYADCVK